MYIQIDLLMSSLTVLRWVYNDKEIWYFVAVSLLLLSILLSLIFGKPHTSQENFPLLSATEVSRAKSSILPKVKSFYFLYVFTLKIEKRGYALCKQARHKKFKVRVSQSFVRQSQSRRSLPSSSGTQSLRLRLRPCRLNVVPFVDFNI